MKVQTKAYGLIDIDERQKVVFPSGLFGFESIKEYVLLDAVQQPYFWLQSVENEHPAFVLIDPFLFRSDYEIDVNDTELQEIGIAKQDDALVFSLVTVPSDGPVTANLQGPIVINRQTRKGKQLILNDPRWKTKHDIMSELSQHKVDDSTKRMSC
ncbi:MAG: flagellar assembly protein FliW [Termitinemataceae bacterium]|nr:MAG: flagellar assembly protein FliW [Termitinemataceae bacterium]